MCTATGFLCGACHDESDYHYQSSVFVALKLTRTLALPELSGATARAGPVRCSRDTFLVARNFILKMLDTQHEKAVHARKRQSSGRIFSLNGPGFNISGMRLH